MSHDTRHELYQQRKREQEREARRRERVRQILDKVPQVKLASEARTFTAEEFEKATRQAQASANAKP